MSIESGDDAHQDPTFFFQPEDLEMHDDHAEPIADLEENHSLGDVGGGKTANFDGLGDYVEHDPGNPATDFSSLDPAPYPLFGKGALYGRKRPDFLETVMHTSPYDTSREEDYVEGEPVELPLQMLRMHEITFTDETPQSFDDKTEPYIELPEFPHISDFLHERIQRAIGDSVGRLQIEPYEAETPEPTTGEQSAETPEPPRDIPTETPEDK